jgi:hypothetical protein
MRRLLSICAVITAMSLAACGPAETPEPPPPAEEALTAPETPAAPALDPGPYTNAWDSAEFTTFNHTLAASGAGPHTLTLHAQTNSPGGETVAVYLADATGAPQTGWRMFVIATTQGETATETVEFPQSGALPVAVVIENASGRAFAGTYTLTVTD